MQGSTGTGTVLSVPTAPSSRHGPCRGHPAVSHPSGVHSHLFKSSGLGRGSLCPTEPPVGCERLGFQGDAASPGLSSQTDAHSRTGLDVS